MDWPILCIPSNGDRMAVKQDMTSLSTARRPGIKHGWFNDLRIIDSDGKMYCVIDAVVDETNAVQWILSFFGGRTKVKLKFDTCTEPSVIALDEMKELVRDNLLKHRERFESGRSMAEFRSLIRECQTHREVMDCLPR